MDFIARERFRDRVRGAVSAAWQIFARKVGGGRIPVSRETSMQLHFAVVLQQVLPLTIQREGESMEIDLEVGVQTAARRRKVDILVTGRSGLGTTRFAIELKCYRAESASGGGRGANDIFRKDIYADLHVLEEYLAADVADVGIALVMNDYEHFVHPRVKRGKSWAYDTSHGTVFPGGHLTVPIGGDDVDLLLRRHYHFQWIQHGTMWFLELEGYDVPSVIPEPST